MRKRLFMLAFCLLIMACLPFLSTKNGFAFLRDEVKGISNQMSGEKESENIEEFENQNNDNSKFNILDTGSGKIVEIDEKEFCIGTVAYEMPPSFEKEALKAQCVAAYTYFCRLRQQQKENPDEKLKGADFSANLSENQFYLDDKALHERWGALYDESIKKIKNAVDEVFGTVIKDSDGKLVNSVYHAISSGKTENSEDVFGGYDSCLRAVSSPFDKYAPAYETKVEVNTDDFKKKISALSDKADLSGKPDNYISKTDKSISGTVKTINICGIEFTGSDIRTAFNLRSADFQVSYSNNKFIFNVLGYGHGAGMSQYGANYMAQQGADYKEILKHYYTGITIVSPE